MKTEKEIIIELLNALILAEEHLDWCGWGDTYERECARNDKLPEVITNAIVLAREYLG
jgi:hypothetical protein